MRFMVMITVGTPNTKWISFQEHCTSGLEGIFPKRKETTRFFGNTKNMDSFRVTTAYFCLGNADMEFAHLSHCFYMVYVLLKM